MILLASKLRQAGVYYVFSTHDAENLLARNFPTLCHKTSQMRGRPRLYSNLQGWQYFSNGRKPDNKPIFDKRRAEARNVNKMEMSKEFGRGRTFASLFDEIECDGGRGQPATAADRKLAEIFFSDDEIMRRTKNCKWYYEIMDVFAGRDASSFGPEFSMAFGHQAEIYSGGQSCSTFRHCWDVQEHLASSLSLSNQS